MPTLRKQLKDPYFAAWMKKPPRRDENPPYKNWRVLVQRKKKGPWARTEFNTYAEGYAFVMKNLEKYHDMVLISKRWPFKPPMVRDKLTDRVEFKFPPGFDDPATWWCPFCRRMTKFKWFKSHHNLKLYLCGHTRQCEICGAGIKFTNPKEWRW